MNNENFINKNINNIMTLAEARILLRKKTYIWKLDTKEDELVKIRKDGTGYILEPVKSHKGWII